MLTIVMPAYNAEKFIKESIQCIIDQVFKTWDLYVIDDYSTDGTAEIIKEFASKDARIHYVKNEENLRVVKTMNKGLALADSQYFTRVDSDDLVQPNHFQNTISFLEQNPEYSFCGSNVTTIDENGKFGRRWYYESDNDWIKISSIFACPFLQSSVVGRLQSWLDVGGYREDMDLVEDYELWLRVVSKYKTHNLQDFGIKYRLHSNNISQRNKTKILHKLESLYTEYKNVFPIDLQALDLHARMEYGDWERISVAELNRIKKWRKTLLNLNASNKFYSTDLYKNIVDKYFTNAFLKIISQNASKKVKILALFNALLVSPQYFQEIFKRKKESVQPI